MNVSEIVTAFGAYYESSGQNKSRILSLLSQGLETPMHCTPVKTDDTVFKLGQITSGTIVQAFQKGWTPKSPHAFQPNELRLFKIKIDDELYPDDIEAIWLGFLGGDTNMKKDWPLVKYLIEHPEQGYIATINRDMELLEYGKGVYVEPTPGTAGIAGNSMDGLVVQLQRGVDKETINSINIGALDKDTIFDQVELFVDGIDRLYQSVQMPVYMDPNWVRHYLRDKREQGFYSFSSEGEVNRLSMNVDFTLNRLVPLPSLVGTNVMFATPKVNLLHLTKRSQNKTQFNIQEYRRNVSIMADWWEGLGFGIDGAVFTNIQPSASGSSD